MEHKGEDEDSYDEDSYDESGDEANEEDGWSDNEEDERLNSLGAENQNGDDDKEQQLFTPRTPRKERNSLSRKEVRNMTPRQRRGTLKLAGNSLHVVSEGQALHQQEAEQSRPTQQDSRPFLPAQTRTKKRNSTLSLGESGLRQLNLTSITNRSDNNESSDISNKVQKDDIDNQNQGDNGYNEKKRSSTSFVRPDATDKNRMLNSPLNPSTTESINAHGIPVNSHFAPREKLFLGMARSTSLRGMPLTKATSSPPVRQTSFGMKGSPKTTATTSTASSPSGAMPSLFDEILEECYQDMAASISKGEQKEKTATIFDLAIESLFDKNKPDKTNAVPIVAISPIIAEMKSDKGRVQKTESNGEVMRKLGSEISSLEQELQKSNEKEVDQIKEVVMTSDAVKRIKGSRLMNKSVDLTEALLELIDNNVPSEATHSPMKTAKSSTTLIPTASTPKLTVPMSASASSLPALKSQLTPEPTLNLNSTLSITSVGQSNMVSASCPALSPPAKPEMIDLGPPIAGITFKRVGHIGSNADGSLTFEGETVISSLLLKSDSEKLTKKGSLLNGIFDKMKTKKV